MSPVLVLHKRRGAFVAWVGNFLVLLGSVVRFPARLVMDTVHVCKGTAQDGLLRSRFVALSARLRGLV